MRAFLFDGSWRLLVVLVLLHALPPAVAHGETRHVLVLSSSERPVAPQSGFADALVRELIRSSRDPIQFIDVPLQPARAAGQAPDDSMADRIRAAFGSHSLDLVMTIGGPAAMFAQQARPDLFPGTPMLIAGVDRRFVENATLSDMETTVATEHDPALMIDEILRLLPETRTVMVVVGSSQLEQFWLQQMKREFRRFEDRVRFVWTNELSFDEIVGRSRTMPADSAIFFAILSMDGKGEPRVEGDTVTALHAAANVPLFALYGMGSGIVGGPLLSTDALSRTTAQVALRLLDGESPGRIRTAIQRGGPPTYDGRELRRWGIDLDRLPTGSIVLFPEPTFWTRFRRPIMVGALVSAIPLLIAAAVLGLVKRRRVQTLTPAALAMPAGGSADATVTVWVAGADGRRVETGPTPGTTQHDWLSLVHPDDVDRCREIYRSAFEKREPFQMEYRVRAADGMVQRILDTGVPRLAGKEFEGYVGSAVDITSLGQAHAELSSLSRHLLQAHERDSAALAKTLHEDVCQRIMALTLRLYGLRGVTSDGQVQETVADISEQLASLVGEISAVLDPVHQRLALVGLAAASRRLCEDVAARSGIAVHFEEADVPRSLPPEIALAVFRVLQERTASVVAHSAVREIWVTLRGTGAGLRLQIVDRGGGVDTPHATPASGVGLVASRERLKLVNGTIEVTSRRGEGTRVEVNVPIQ